MQLPNYATRANRALQAPTAEQAVKATQAASSIKAPTLDRLRYAGLQNKQAQTFISNYNDPTELNSYIDALINREAVSKKFGDTWGTISTASGTISVLAFVGAAVASVASLFTGGATVPVAATLAKVGAAAAVPAIPAAIDVTYNTTIKPIVAGKPKELVLNTLINLDETLNVLANPVKGLFLEGPSGFAKATGLADGGRVNYNYNTGNIIGDIALELVTDPLNWLDFGVGGAIKSIATNTVKALTEELSQNATETIVKSAIKNIDELDAQQLYKTINKQLTKTARDIAREYSKISLKELTKEELQAYTITYRNRIRQSLVRAIKKEIPDITASEINQLLNQVNKNAITNRFVKSINEQINNITLDKLSSNTLKALSSLQEVSDNYQMHLLKGALYTSGFGLGFQALRKGWNTVKEWQNNRTLNNLEALDYFDFTKGINLAKYEEAKLAWEANEKYFTMIGDQASPQTIDTLHSLFTTQLLRDQQYIKQILQDNKDAVTKAAALDAKFQELYGYNFLDYIGYLKGISLSEGDKFKAFVKYAEDRYEFLKQLAPKTTPIKQDFYPEDIKSFTTKQNKLLNQLSKISGKPSDLHKAVDIVYGIQKNKEDVTNTLLFEPTIQQVFKILSDPTQGIGVLFSKIVDDVEARNPEASAEFLQKVQNINQAVKIYNIFLKFYEEFAVLELPAIKGIDDATFKKYVRDQIFGFNKPIDELLAQFDTITVPHLMHNLDVFLYFKNFKVMDYPGLQEQLAGIFKSLLIDLDNAGSEYLETTVLQNFTKDITDISETEQFKAMLNIAPEYSKQMYTINSAIEALKNILANVRDSNQLNTLNILLTNDILTKNNITTQQLTDAGLALKIVAESEYLKYFKVPKGTSEYDFRQMNELGKKINRLEQKFLQFESIFSKKDLQAVSTILKNADMQTLLKMYTPFEYLKIDTVENISQQLAILALFKKEVYSNKNHKIPQRQFMQQISTLPRNIVDLILRPNIILVTDFAWGALQQTDWVRKQYNQNIINLITAYDNLGTLPGKVAQDFINTRQVLSDTGLDRVQNIQLERYAKKLKKIQKFFDNLSEVFDKKFDANLAKSQIEYLRNMLNTFEDLDTPANRDIINTLEGYWNKTIELRQDPKYMKDKPEYVDDITPLWNKLKKLNYEIVQHQFRQVNKDSLKYVLDPKTYQEYFIEHPESGEHLLTILTDPNYNLTELDYKHYVNTFLKNIKKDTWTGTPKDDQLMVPYNLIPASLLKTHFRYYYDVLGIDNPALVYALSYSNISGYIMNKTPNDMYILANPLADLENLTSNYASLHQFKTTIIHESGHAVLRKIFKQTVQHTEFLENFEKQFINIFGEKIYNVVLKTMYKHYAPEYGFAGPLEKQQKANVMRIVEEVFAFTLSDDLLNIFKIAVRYKLLTAEEFNDVLALQKSFTDFSEKLIEQLRIVAQSKPEEIKKTVSFAQHVYNLSEILTKEVQRNPVTLWDPIREQQKLNKAIYTATDANARSALYTLINQTPEDFLIDLINARGIITFSESDISDKLLKNTFNKLKNNTPENLIHFKYDAATQRWWVILNKNVNAKIDGRNIYLDTNKVIKVTPPALFNEFQIVDKLIDDKNFSTVNMLNQMEADLESLTGSKLGYSQGEPFDIKTAQDIYAQMPKEFQKLVNEDLFLNAANYKICLYNCTVFGTTASKQKLGMYNSNQLINMRNAYMQSAGYVKARTEYVHTVFDSMLSINSPNSIWIDYTDEALLEALQQNSDYVLATLTHHKKYGMKVVEIYPTSVEAITKAREYGATIIPRQVYKDMYNTINHRLGSTGFMKIWSRLLYLFKFGYLMRPGAWIRNFIDTYIKSYLEMGSESKTYLQQAHIILNESDKINAYIRKRTKEKDGLISSELIREYFDLGLNKYLTYEQYLELDKMVFKQGVNQNVMYDLYSGPGGDIWHTITKYTGKLVDDVNKAERYNRLAVYLYYLDKGYDNTSALAKLAKTHFDYSFKNKAEQLAELVFPFTTFTLRNLSYWVEMIEKHPWILRNYVHLMSPTWDFQDYTPEEIATNYVIQNQILYGQLELGEFNDKIVSFKANPSIGDAIQMFSNPIYNIYEKLIAPAAYTIDTLEGGKPNWTNLVPVIGPAIHSAQQAIKTGSPAPSIISVQNAPKRLGTTTPETDKYTDNTYRTPKYRNNKVFDLYATKGVKSYRNRFYPVVDIAHEIKMRYNINVANRIKNRVRRDVYKGIRYRIRTDINRFR